MYYNNCKLKLSKISHKLYTSCSVMLCKSNYTKNARGILALSHISLMALKCVFLSRGNRVIIQGESLARGPKLFSMYTVEKRGFLFRKYWQTGSFKACQTAFRTEFGERCAPSKCCIQKLVKKLETRGSRSNACRLLSLVPIEGQSV